MGAGRDMENILIKLKERMKMKKNSFKIEENKVIEENMVKLIQDEDYNVDGAGTTAIASAISGTLASAIGLANLFTISTACTKSCRRS